VTRWCKWVFVKAPFAVYSMKITVAHSAVLDVDLNIRRARGGASSKLVPLERGVCVEGGERHSSCSFLDVSHGDIVCVFSFNFQQSMIGIVQED
jgi:hypothetical protein